MIQNHTCTAQSKGTKNNEKYYKKIIPTNIKRIRNKIDDQQLANVDSEIGIEVAGICYELQQKDGYVSAMLDEDDCHVEIRIPPHLDITAITDSKHDEMVKIIGHVKVEKCMIHHDGVVKKYSKQWIAVRHMMLLKSPREITYHYLNVMYSKDYLNKYESILQKMRKNVNVESTNNSNNQI